MLIEKYDGFTKPEDVELSKIPVWIQLKGLPIAYRKKEVLESLCKRVGRVKTLILTPRGDGNHVRIRVNLDVNKPLSRFVSVTREGKKVFYQVYYEKIPKFCYVCGLLGHTHFEHGNGKHEVKDLQWGDWLLAPLPEWIPFRGARNPRGVAVVVDQEAGI